MITYYITGLTGFLGNNLLLELEKTNDFKIIAFVLPNEIDFECLKKPYIKCVTGSLLDKEDIRRFLSEKGEGDKIVIHIAGRVSTYRRHDKLTMQINYDGTKNVVDSMNEIGGFRKLVYISSVDSMPRNNHHNEITEVGYYNLSRVDGVYGRSKALANNYIIDNLNAESVIILPSAIIGPNDPRLAPLNHAIKSFLNDKLPAVTKGGYNLVDSRDVAKSILLASYFGKNKESYLITGNYISVQGLIDLAAELSNKKTIKRKVPLIIIKIISPFIEIHSRLHRKMPLFNSFSMDCLNQNSNYSYKKAHSQLGYEPTPIKETIKDTIDWMNNSGYLTK